MLAHDFFVKYGSLLFEAWFEEALTHHLDDIIDDVSFQAGEFDPFSGKTRSHFHSVLQIKSIVFSAAEHGKKKLAHAHLIAASIFEYRDNDQKEKKIDDNY